MSKSILALLDEGIIVLAASEQKERQKKDVAQSYRDRSWRALRKAAQTILGEMADDLAETAPEDWSNDAQKALTFMPFGKVSLTATFASTGDNPPRWDIVAQGAYAVATSYVAKLDEAGVYVVGINERRHTESLPEAVALCKRSEGLYAECLASCEKQTAERKKPGAIVPSPPKLTDNEIALVMALRKITEPASRKK